MIASSKNSGGLKMTIRKGPLVPADMVLGKRRRRVSPIIITEIPQEIPLMI